MTNKYDIWVRFDEFKELSLKVKNMFRITVWVVAFRSRSEKKKIIKKLVTSSKVRTIILNSGLIVSFKPRNSSKEIGSKFQFKYKI